MMARDAHDDGRSEDQGREQHGSPRPGGHQDGADHDGDRQGQQHLQDLPLVLDRHEGEEAAGHDEADGIERAQAPHESLARLASSQSSAIVRLAQRCPSATGPRTTATNGAPPISTMLARRKR